MYAARLLVVFVAVGIVLDSTSFTASGQSAWSSGAPQSTTNNERYAQPLNSAAATISQQTQNTVSSAGNALRDGLDASYRAAEQTVNSTAAQLQSSFSGSPNQPTTNGGVNGNVSSPWPTTSSAAPVTQTARGAAAAPSGNGWSSIGTSIAAPPLILPQSSMATPNYNGAAGTAPPVGRNGPNFPASSPNDQQVLHSVLSDPARSPAPPSGVSAPDWSKGSNGETQSAPAIISRTGNQSAFGNMTQDSGLVPVQGGSLGQSEPPTNTAARPNDWLNSWNQQSQASQATIGSTVNRPATNSNAAGPSLNEAQGGQFANAPNGQLTNPPSGQFTNATGAQAWNQSNGQFAGQPNGQMPSGQPFNNYNPGNMNPNAGATASGQMNNGQMANNPIGGGTNSNGRSQAGLGNAEQPAWVPLVLAVLGLAASFAANLYLGASYLDARQKYQSLVRKTADTFRRVSAAAA